MHGSSARNGTSTAEATSLRSPESREPFSPTVVRDVADDLSVRSVPVYSGVPNHESFEFLPSPSKLRTTASDPAGYDSMRPACADEMEMPKPPAGNCPRERRGGRDELPS